MSVLDYLVARLKRGVITFFNIVTLVNRDYPYDDSETDTCVAAKKNYIVGDNNVLSKGDQHKRFVSKSTLILCTQDFYVRFNNPNNVTHTLQANTWFEFMHNIRWIEYWRVDTDGTIYIHVEGVLPQEARTPE